MIEVSIELHRCGWFCNLCGLSSWLFHEISKKGLGTDCIEKYHRYEHVLALGRCHIISGETHCNNGWE